MAIGPEIARRAAIEIDAMRGARVRRAEAGDCWLAVFVNKEDSLFFSWDADAFGVCRAGAGEVREMLAASDARPTVLDAVRSHVVGAYIVGASAPSRDRVIRIELRRDVGAGVSSARTLVLEASGRYSNAALLDEAGRVIECAKHIYPDMNRMRTVVPGLPYAPPPPISGVMLDDLAPSDDLSRVVGLGRPLISAALSLGEEGIAGAMHMRDDTGAVVYQMIKNYLTAWPTAICGAVPVAASRALEASRRVVIEPLSSSRAARISRRVASVLERARDVAARKIGECERARAELGAAARATEIGRLILANAHAIPRRAEAAELVEWTDDGERTVEVALDPMLDAPSNAEKWFARSRKKRAAAERADRLMPSLVRELEDVEEQIEMLSCCTGITALLAFADEVCGAPARKGRTERPLPPHGRADVEELGASIYWGMSAKGNHYTTFRVARPDDIWMHASGIPGAHVVIRFSRMPDEETFDRAIALGASCASLYSRAHGERTQVDFTEKKHVRAIAGGGGSHVTYKDFSSITSDGSAWKDIENAHGVS